MQAKFQDHRSSCSGKEDYLRFLPYMGKAAILSCDLDHLYKLSFPLPKGHRELIICLVDSNGKSLIFDTLFCIS